MMWVQFLESTISSTLQIIHGRLKKKGRGKARGGKGGEREDGEEEEEEEVDKYTLISNVY